MNGGLKVLVTIKIALSDPLYNIDDYNGVINVKVCTLMISKKIGERLKNSFPNPKSNKVG